MLDLNQGPPVEAAQRRAEHRRLECGDGAGAPSHQCAVCSRPYSPWARALHQMRTVSVSRLAMEAPFSLGEVELNTPSDMLLPPHGSGQAARAIGRAAVLVLALERERHNELAPSSCRKFSAVGFATAGASGSDKLQV